MSHSVPLALLKLPPFPLAFSLLLALHIALFSTKRVGVFFFHRIKPGERRRKKRENTEERKGRAVKATAAPAFLGRSYQPTTFLFEANELTHSLSLSPLLSSSFVAFACLFTTGPWVHKLEGERTKSKWDGFEGGPSAPACSNRGRGVERVVEVSFQLHSRHATLTGLKPGYKRRAK